MSAKALKGSLSVIAPLLFSAVCLADPIFRINDGNGTNIDKFDICREIANASGKDIMVPTGTQAEWQSFANATTPAGVTRTNLHDKCMREFDSFEAPMSGLPTGWTSGFHIGWDGEMTVHSFWASEGLQASRWSCNSSSPSVGDMKKTFDLTNIGTIKMDVWANSSGRGSPVVIRMTIDGQDVTSSAAPGEIVFDVSSISGNQEVLIRVEAPAALGCWGAVDNLRLYSK